MHSKKNSIIFIISWLSCLNAQERHEQNHGEISKDKFHNLDPFSRIKKEIATLSDRSTLEKHLTAEQQQDMLNKYCFELYQLGCASFNPNTQAIKKLWTTIPQQITRELINTPWCVNTYGQKVFLVYYATPHSDWLELIELFIKADLNVTHVLNTSDDTLLHRLVDISTLCNSNYDTQHIEQLIEIIIKAGANVNAQNSVGKTPLHKACEHQNKSFIDLLLELGASKTIRDDWNRMPRSYLSLH